MHGWLTDLLADIDHQFSMAPGKLPGFELNYSHFLLFSISSAPRIHEKIEEEMDGEN